MNLRDDEYASFSTVGASIAYRARDARREIADSRRDDDTTTDYERFDRLLHLIECTKVASLYFTRLVVAAATDDDDLVVHGCDATSTSRSVAPFGDITK